MSDNEIGKQLMAVVKGISFIPSKGMDLKRENANIDGDSAMGTMLRYGTETAKTFNMHYLFSPRFCEAHRNGEIHIHDLDFAALTTTCTQIDIKKLFTGGFNTGHGYLREPNTIQTASALACIAIQSNQCDQHGGQSIAQFDYGLAPAVARSFIKNLKFILSIYGIPEEAINDITDKLKKDAFPGGSYDSFKSLLSKKRLEALALELQQWFNEYTASSIIDKTLNKTDKDCYQAMEALIHNLNTMQSRAGAQVPFSSINYGTDTTPEGRMIIKNILLAEDAGLGDGETPIFPIHIFKVKDGVNGLEGDPNYEFFELACKVSAKRLFPNFEFLDAPFNAYYLKKLPDGTYDPNTEVSTMGCVHKDSVVTYKLDGKVYVESIGRLYDHIDKLMTSDHQICGNSAYYDTSDIDLKIFDSKHDKFVQVLKVIRNENVTNWKKVIYDNGRVLVATDDHPLPIEGRGRTYVRDINIGDYAPVTQYQPIGNGKCDLSVDDAWMMGAILCDGAITLSGVTLYFGPDETELVENAVRIAQTNEWSVRTNKQERGVKGSYWEVAISGKHIASYYMTLFGGQVKEKRHIPTEIFNAPYDIRIAFMAGMIDADGYVNKHHNNKGHGGRVQIGSTNKELALQQAALSNSLRLPSKVYENRYNGEDSTKIRYRVEFASSHDILNALVCKKKKALLDDPMFYPLHPTMPPICRIVAIEDCDGGFYSYDVETESDFFDVNGIISHNCRTRVMGNTYDPTRETTCGRGNLSFTTINLPRIALKHKDDIDGFFAELEEKVHLVHDQLLERLEVQSRRTVRNHPFLMGQGVWLDSEKLGIDDECREVWKHGTLTVGFIGLAETLTALLGKHHGESGDAQALGLEIVGRIRELSDARSKKEKLNFSVIATPAEGLAGRFVKMDRELYGVIDGVTDKEFYTNSYHIPVNFKITAFNKIRIEAPYHALCNGGHITYIEMDGDPLQNLEAFKSVVQAMKLMNIGYGAINHPVDRCPICNYTGVIGDECPRCGVKEDQELTEEEIANIRKHHNH